MDAGAGHLLARVIVNRLWQHHFGRGIVATPSDFGAQGEQPTHPELLDYLAGELIRGGWRLKPMHKLIMTSARLPCRRRQTDAGARALDPDNALFWRRPRRRLEGEAIRDAMLAVSGRARRNDVRPRHARRGDEAAQHLLHIKRSQLPPMMVTFDAPDTLQSLGQRGEHHGRAAGAAADEQRAGPRGWPQAWAKQLWPRKPARREAVGAGVSRPRSAARRPTTKLADARPRFCERRQRRTKPPARADAARTGAGRFLPGAVRPERVCLRRVTLHRLAMNHPAPSRRTASRTFARAGDFLRRTGAGAGMLGAGRAARGVGPAGDRGAQRGGAGESARAASRRTFPAKAKSVIWLFMNGGQSQVDTWDYKPELEKARRQGAAGLRQEHRLLHRRRSAR